MDKIDLLFALKHPPREIIKYFQSKGLKVTMDWQEIWQEAHRRAFTVAHVARLDVLQDIHDEVGKAIAGGETALEFRKNLMPRLKAKGWWGKQMVADKAGNIKEVQLGSPYRLDNIYRTNLQTAYQAGHYKTQEENKDIMPYWEFVAVMDNRTRPSHAALNGKIFLADDPFWETHYPPLDWGCRCGVIARTAAYVKSKGIVVSDSSGYLVTKEVTVGENSLTGPRKAEISGYKTMDREGGPVTVWTGPGWNYNPGKEAQPPDLNKYSPEIKALY